MKKRSIENEPLDWLCFFPFLTSCLHQKNEEYKENERSDDNHQENIINETCYWTVHQIKCVRYSQSKWKIFAAKMKYTSNSFHPINQTFKSVKLIWIWRQWTVWWWRCGKRQWYTYPSVLSRKSKLDDEERRCSQSIHVNRHVNDLIEIDNRPMQWYEKRDKTKDNDDDDDEQVLQFSCCRCVCVDLFWRTHSTTTKRKERTNERFFFSLFFRLLSRSLCLASVQIEREREKTEGRRGKKRTSDEHNVLRFRLLLPDRSIVFARHLSFSCRSNWISHNQFVDFFFFDWKEFLERRLQSSFSLTLGTHHFLLFVFKAEQ